MRKRPKQPKWVKAFKRKVRTSSYLEHRAYELFAASNGITVEELEKYFPRNYKPKEKEND